MTKTRATPQLILLRTLWEIDIGFSSKRIFICITKDMATDFALPKFSCESYVHVGSSYLRWLLTRLIGGSFEQLSDWLMQVDTIGNAAECFGLAQIKLKTRYPFLWFALYVRSSPAVITEPA